MRIRSIVVLGGGSAGLLAALTLKRKIPALSVEVIYSSRLGVIGVGEGTTPYLPSHIHHYLGYGEHEVFEAIRPVFKLGIRFTWGKRPFFDYTFTRRQQVWRWPDLPRNNGFYSWENVEDMDLGSSLISANKAVPRRQDGVPDVPPVGQNIAWHIENKTFVGWLEKACRAAGVTFTDSELAGAEQHPETGDIVALKLIDGTERRADLFVDSSGFASELLGKVMQVPFDDFAGTLRCNRAVAGGWDRTDEPVVPCTVADSMQAGWCWRIDHPHRIHRGYVYSSAHLSEDQAIAEYLKLCPRAEPPVIVKFRSGAYHSGWTGNVIGVGNAAGFVEPLEATALMIICLQCRWLTDGLIDSGLSPTPTMKSLFCRMSRTLWRETRDFLGIHYRFNDRFDNPFWRECRADTPLGDLEPLVEFYKENGPSGIAAGLLGANNPYGLDGMYALLMGLKVPHAKACKVTPQERQIWYQRTANHRRIAQQALSMPEAEKQLCDPAVWERIRGRR